MDGTSKGVIMCLIDDPFFDASWRRVDLNRVTRSGEDWSDVARRAWETRRANAAAAANAAVPTHKPRPSGQSVVTPPRPTPAPKVTVEPARVEAAPTALTRLPNGLPERFVKNPTNVRGIYSGNVNPVVAVQLLSGRTSYSPPPTPEEAKAQLETIAKSLVSDAEGVQFDAAVEQSMGGLSFRYTAPGVTVSRQLGRDTTGKLYAYHAYFSVTGTQQGAGLAKAVLRGSFDTYSKLGVDYVKVGANLDVGGYAWARFGFLPSDHEEWRRVGDNVRMRASGLLSNGKISQQKHDEIVAITREQNPASLWKISDQRDTLTSTRPSGVRSSRGPDTVGMALLKGLSWDGKIDMRNPAQLARLGAYLSRPEHASEPRQRRGPDPRRSEIARRASQTRIRRQQKRRAEERRQSEKRHRRIAAELESYRRSQRVADKLLGPRY